ncbi:MAG: sigma-70 family RNA polymerase sigma factor [Blastocatellia bacterium]
MIDIGQTENYRDDMPDKSQFPDAELITKCLENDAEAWETLVRRYQRLISSIAFRFGLTADDAADIFQSVCLIMLQQLPVLRQQAKLSSWLITITVRECWKFREKRGRTDSLDEREDENLPEPADETQPPAEAVLLLIEQQHLVRRAVEQLSPQCRALIEHLFYSDQPLPYAELSRQLGMPVASIGPTRGRCLTRLKEALTQLGFESPEK